MDRFAKAGNTAGPRPDFRRVRLDRAVGRRISDAYVAAPSWDERALPAYDAFRRETIEQFDLLLRGGVTVEVVDYDPYPDDLRMAQDLSQHRLRVFSTQACRNPYPFLTDEENDMFRAVHDAFGHGASGCGFDVDGEEGAWLRHSYVYSRLARPALATETRGQNCAFNFHHRGERFPDQKLALLPEAFS